MHSLLMYVAFGISGINFLKCVKTRLKYLEFFLVFYIFRKLNLRSYFHEL